VRRTKSSLVVVSALALITSLATTTASASESSRSVQPSSTPAAITYGPDNWGDMDIDCDLITTSSFFYTDKLNGFVRQVVTNSDKCAWTLKGVANVQGNNIVLPADATVEITSKKAGNEGFVLTISTNPTPPSPSEPPAPPTPVSLADALNNVRYQYPDFPAAVNGVNVGQPGQNFRDTFFDCNAIAETATYYVPPPSGVTTMRVDLINFLNCSVTTNPTVTPSISGNFQRRTLSTNGQAAITNTATGRTLTVIYGNVPAATSALSSTSARGAVGASNTPITLNPINIAPTGYSIDPTLPDGLSIDPTTGAITGTPTTASSGQYAITASDGTKQATGILTLDVSATAANVVTFDQNLGTNPIARAVAPGHPIVLPPTNSLASNSVFGGWYTEPNGGGDFAGMDGSSYTPTSSLTLYAKWAPAVTITFQRVSTADPHPVFPPELQPLVNSSSNLVMPVAQGSLITLPVPTRTNAGFRGWYNATSCPTSGTQPSTFIGPGGAQVVAPSTSTATWRACWQTSNLNIDFDPRSGTFTGSDASCTGTASCRRTWTAVGGPLAPSGRPQVTTPTPSRAGHIFNGWFTAISGGTRVAGANEPLGVDTIEPSPSTSARIYRAQWTPLMTLDPGEGNEVNDVRCQRDPNTPRLCLIPWVDNNVILPTPTSPSGLIPTGWYSGTTLMGGPGEKILFAPWGAITVVSTWIAPVVPATVSFDVQADDVAGISPQSTSVGARITLPRPTREGYAFRGWFTHATAGVPALTSGGQYTVTGDVTLFARWISRAVPPRPVQPDPLVPPTPPTPDRGTIVDEDGQETSVVVRPIPRADDNSKNVGVSVGRVADDTNGVAGFEIALEGINTEGDLVELSPDGLLILSADRRVAAAGTGFVPQAPVAFYLLPSAQPIGTAQVFTRSVGSTSADPILLDTLTVDDTGDFTGTLILPDGLSSGDYLVQAVGAVSSGEILTVTLGVRVEASGSPAPIPGIPAGPPLNVTATPSQASAVITWMPPHSTGDFPITTYQVIGAPGGTCLVAAPAQTCIITGLTNGVEYTFRVRALTGAGWGPYSEPSPPITPGAGSAPSILVSGGRTDVRGRPGVQVTGVTTGLQGSVVIPRFRMAKTDRYANGVGIRTIDNDGSFVWERVTRRWIYVYFVVDTVRSNRVVIR
jgi:uncharacterized repeat protein (TIGR02543 family)